MVTKDRIGALLILAFAAAYLLLTAEIRMLPFQRAQPFNAQTMPYALGSAAVALSLLMLVLPGSKDRVDVAGFRWGLGLVMIALMIFYGLTVRTLGFIPSTTLFLIGGYAALGERNPLLLLGASVPVVVGFWLLMTQVLDVFVAPWPPGAETWFGGA